VTSRERMPQLPDVVPLAEAVPELKGYELLNWFGMFAPAATPEPVVVVESESIGVAFGKLRERSEGLEKLKEAKQKVEEVARAVNEGRRRVEVVREVLGAGHAKDGVGQGGVASIGIPKVGVVNASVSRMRSLRAPKPSPMRPVPTSEFGLNTPTKDKVTLSFVGLLCDAKMSW